MLHVSRGVKIDLSFTLSTTAGGFSESLALLAWPVIPFSKSSLLFRFDHFVYNSSSFARSSTSATPKLFANYSILRPRRRETGATSSSFETSTQRPEIFNFTIFFMGLQWGNHSSPEE